MMTGLARFWDNVCPLTWDYDINCTQKNTDNQNSSETDVLGSERFVKFMRSVEKPPPDAYYNMPSALTGDLIGLERFRRLVDG